MKFLGPFLVICSLLLSSCSTVLVVTADPPTDTPQLPSLTPFLAEKNTPTPTLTPLPTETLTPTTTQTPTPQPSPTATPTWIFNSTGKVIAPILLYHHVADIEPASRYYISPQVFQAQMEALHQWGYTAVPISTIVEVITKGGELPPRPVVITFDDGNEDVYTNAFPIMQELGFVGTFFIIGQTIGATHVVTDAQLEEMISAGWEIGSHSMSHLDLTQRHDQVQYEIGLSKSTLEKELTTKVEVFAYPYGTTDPYLVSKVQDYGYLAAVGLGTSFQHSLATLYYLSRMEVQSIYDMDKFASMLPWHDQPVP